MKTSSIHKSAVAIFALAVLEVSIVGCSKVAGDAVGTKTIHVQLLLNDAATKYAGCSMGQAGYSDIYDGMSVSLTDDSGDDLGDSTMTYGPMTGVLDSNHTSDSCGYYANFDNVPSNKASYSVLLGDGHRGQITNTRQELVLSAVDETTWEMNATLGN